ncbi:hypothetical protein CBR_g48837 [Chara braunii]|uniref:Uncharacterized protein n=1 Tax=Chara braunii TaxID=69332 RepID=A0A388M3G3_CHABU|nr:hypothetical protein CBR_g48837 [Chara braunii]|eukprot:GBG89128.1 hypothetical protein CBR_g48837 [Chara braunii]
MAWKKLFLIGPMEVNAWTAGSNGPTEMCGVIPKINVRITSQEIKGECAMARRRTFLEERPLGIEPPREVPGGVEVSLPAASEGWHQVADWVGVELAENMVYLVTKVEWHAAENGEWNPDPRGHVRAEGRLYVSENGWREFGVRLASGEDPLSMFEGAWQLVWQAGFEFADPGVDDVTADLRVAMVGSFELPSEIGNDNETRPDAAATHAPATTHGKQRWMGGVTPSRLSDSRIGCRMESRDPGKRTGVHDGGMFVGWLGKEMAMEEGINDQQSGGNQGTNGDGERNEGSARDRESAKLEGTREDGKDASIGESSGKVGGSKRGPQENREGGNDMRTSPRNSAGATPKKTKVLDTSHKLAEIEKRTAECKAKLIEQMMAGDEEDPQDAGSREGSGTGQDEARYEGKDNSHKGTPSKKGKDKSDPHAEGTENAMTPPAIDSGTSRLPATPKVTGACDGLWSLRESVLGWFDPEGTPKIRERQRESKKGKEPVQPGKRVAPKTVSRKRRFILRIDPTNVVGALKNYKPIDPTVGRWIGFIWQFDYKVERIAGFRNRADELSRVCITPEGVEDAEPIDAFLEYEGGTLVVDNEMADPAITTGQLLIQILEKGAPAVVAELREGPVTMVRRKEEKDSWGAEVGAREELMAMAVEGGRDLGAEGVSAGESSSKKRKLYVGFDHNLVVNTGGRKQGTRGPSPLREGEPIELPSDSDPSSEEDGNPEEGQRPGENDPVEFIDLTSDEDEDEVTTPTREEWGRGEQSGEKKDKWIEEFGYEFKDWFDQWGTILRYQWIMKAREKLGRGEDLSPTTFFSEGTLLQFQAIKRLMEQEGQNRARREAQRRPPGH